MKVGSWSAVAVLVVFLGGSSWGDGATDHFYFWPLEQSISDSYAPLPGMFAPESIGDYGLRNVSVRFLFGPPDSVGAQAFSVFGEINGASFESSGVVNGAAEFAGLCLRGCDRAWYWSDSIWLSAWLVPDRGRGVMYHFDIQRRGWDRGEEFWAGSVSKLSMRRMGS